MLVNALHQVLKFVFSFQCQLFAIENQRTSVSFLSLHLQRRCCQLRYQFSTAYPTCGYYKDVDAAITRFVGYYLFAGVIHLLTFTIVEQLLIGLASELLVDQTCFGVSG